MCADADLELAAKHIVKGAFSYSGQRCTAVKVRCGERWQAAGAVYALRGTVAGCRRCVLTGPGMAGKIARSTSSWMYCVRARKTRLAAAHLSFSACACTQLVMAVEEVADELLSKVLAGAKKLTVGRWAGGQGPE